MASLNASGSGTTTVSSSATTTSANVYGGLVNLNYTSGLSNLVVGGGRVNVSSTSALNVLTVSGGTVNLPAGTTTIATANFASGAAASVTPNQLFVTNQLTFNGGASATVSNGNSLTYATNGGNLANTSAPSTLTLGRHVATDRRRDPFLGAPIDITFQRTNGYTGQGAAASGPTTQIWNVLAPGVANDTNITAANNLTNLLDSSGNTLTGTTFGLVAGNAHVYEQATPAIALFGNAGLVKQPSAAPPGPSATWALSGLTASAYDVYAIRSNANNGGQVILNGDPVTFPNQASSGTAFIMNPVGGTPPANCNYTEFASVAPVSGSISITEAAAAATGNEFDISGYQFVPHLPLYTAPVSLPSTNIVAPAGSTLDFGGDRPGQRGRCPEPRRKSDGAERAQRRQRAVRRRRSRLGQRHRLAGLRRRRRPDPGPLRQHRRRPECQRRQRHDLDLAGGRDFGPDGQVQQLRRHRQRGSLERRDGAVTASGAAASVNAGTLKVLSTLNGAAGAAVQVNSGATLAGGPAGNIQVPVTLAAGSTLLPDATAASTALIGNSLTINGGGALQWVYSGSGAEGTLALGSGTLNLPAQYNGNPVFRPQFVTLPSLGTYVMTWSTSPSNQPAWGFDGSLVGVGHSATWADGTGNWDTGGNWTYAVATSATLTYQPTGLQLTGLTVMNVAGTAAPVAGASVLIAPPSNSTVSVTGPGEPVSISTLVIEGSGAATASLALQGNGPLTASSVSVRAGGSLSDDDGGGGALLCPTAFCRSARAASAWATARPTSARRP